MRAEVSAPRFPLAKRCEGAALASPVKCGLQLETGSVAALVCIAAFFRARLASPSPRFCYQRG